MTLIHTALLCEAQTFIEYFKLQKINTNPKIYLKNNIVVLVGGIGKDNSISGLYYIYKQYNIKKAINIGIAGVNNKAINIGDIFCTNKTLQDIPTLNLITNDTPTISSNIKETILYDMEGKYFLDISKKYLNEDNIYIFKVVSDYLDNEILKKDHIKKLFKQYLSIISKRIFEDV